MAGQGRLQKGRGGGKGGGLLQTRGQGRGKGGLRLRERELAVKMRCVATIHMDPVVTDETTTQLRNQVAQLVQTVDPRITIHDFRIVPGPTHTNLVFDAMVPFDLPMEEKAVERAIRDKVRQLPGNYYAVVHAETSYV